MTIFEIIFLAIVQGVTEFLPISSSAHLILPKEVLGWQDQGLAFDVAVHVGSLAAVLIYFRKDVHQLFFAWLNAIFKGSITPESKLAWAVIIGTIPAGVAGVVLNDFIEANLRSISVIAWSTLIFGLLLLWADKSGTQVRTNQEITLKDMLVIGFAQALALIPGTSRSGITMTAALKMGFKREDAARFSFLLSIPLILAAGSLKTVELLGSSIDVDWGAIIGGAVMSGISAYLCIHYFLKFLQKVGFVPFVIYRVILSAVLFAIILF